MNRQSCVYRIGEIVFDYQRAQIIKNSAPEKIEPQVNELLKIFVDNQGQLVSRQQIIDTLWPQRVITDDAFRAVIKKLRKSLNDNAKAPVYIRTIPLKGFVLIAQVDEIKPASKHPGVTRLTFTAIVIALVFSSLLLWYFLSDASHEVQLEPLTTMDGSEVAPAYNSNTHMLIYSHRANKDDYLQLFSKSLSTGKVTRLTFDEANYANAHFSPNGKRVAYTRSTPAETSTIVADFSTDTGLRQQIALPQPIANQRYLQAWSSNGKGLYLSDNKRPGMPQSIAYYDIAQQQLNSVTSPGNPGQGDYFARESFNGQWLAVLRNVGAKNTELLVQHLNSGELAHIYKLPTAYHHLVWGEHDSVIKLSSFFGDFAHYNLATRQLEPASLGSEHINNIFYSCGERCVFARQHNGNYVDLMQQPNPFAPSHVAAHDYMELEGAEDLPQIGGISGNIYFVTQRHRETQLVTMRNKQLDVLQRFAKSSQFATLQLNENETWLAGVVDGRLFVMDLASKQLRYLSTALEHITTVHWDKTGLNLHYARMENGEPVLYRHELNNNITVQVQRGIYAKVQLPDGHIFTIDSDQKGWLQREEHASKFVAQLPSPSANRWSLQGNSLYFTEHAENLAYLNRINLTTGEKARVLLAKNRYLINFALSADGNTLLGIRSLLAQSDLVKVLY